MNPVVNRGETAAVGGLAQLGRCTRSCRRAVDSRGRSVAPQVVGASWRHDHRHPGSAGTAHDHRAHRPLARPGGAAGRAQLAGSAPCPHACAWSVVPCETAQEAAAICRRRCAHA